MIYRPYVIRNDGEAPQSTNLRFLLMELQRCQSWAHKDKCCCILFAIIPIDARFYILSNRPIFSLKNFRLSTRILTDNIYLYFSYRERFFTAFRKLINMEQKIHQGRNVKRFREMLGIKQEALAFDLGEDWNQKKISLLEQKELIEDLLLARISEVLKIPVEAFQNFDEEQGINNIIANTFNEAAYFAGHSATFNVNPLEKLIQLHEEKIALYERMLKEKEEMMGKLEKLIQY